jgi:hypothetical protein
MRTDQVEERVRAAELQLRKTVTAAPPTSNATDALTMLHGAFDDRRRVREALALAACAAESTARK